jgi:ABC-type methionine transport system permease subunit
VAAGSIGSSLLEGESFGGPTLIVGLLAAVAATAYVAKLAQEALSELEEE